MGMFNRTIRSLRHSDFSLFDGISGIVERLNRVLKTWWRLHVKVYSHYSSGIYKIFQALHAVICESISRSCLSNVGLGVIKG